MLLVTKKQICLYIIFNQTLSGLRASLASSLTKMTKERTFSHKLVTTLSTNKATTYSYLSLSLSLSLSLLCTKKANLGLFFVYFCSFLSQILIGKTVDISGIRTRIVRIEGELADHLTTTAVAYNLFLRCTLYFKLKVIKP